MFTHVPHGDDALAATTDELLLAIRLLGTGPTR